MNKKLLAQTILKCVGGKENVNGLTHCVTRLRFSLVNFEKADSGEIEKLPGVLGVLVSGGQFQIIIGAEVQSVYNEIAQLVDGDRPNTVQKEKITIGGVFKNALDTLISCFTPAIPAIAGSGMIKVLVVLLVQFGVLESGSSTYNVLYMIGDSIFHFLPFFVAFNAAKKLKTDIFLSMILAGALLHPNLLGFGETGTYVGFMGIGLQIVDYSAQALPVIFGVWLLKYVDKFADKVSPSLIKIFLRPMISLLVVAPIMLIVIGPASTVLSNAFAVAAEVMMQWGWLAVGINAAVFPLMVLTGTHNATIPLIVQLFMTKGFDPIFLPSGMAANIAEAGAAGAVALKTKNKALKGTALSASLSALLGITEPALYGVNLRLKKPFFSMILGAFIGGCYIGLIGLTAPTFVTPMLLTAPIYVGAGVNMLLGLSCIPLVYFVTFVITYFVGFEDLDAEGAIKSPIEGSVITLEEVNDAAFSSKSMGDGFAIVPSKGEVVAPFDGEVVAIFPTKHAIGLKSTSGIEMLIHVGIDTVNLSGKYFINTVAQGQFVKAGDVLLQFDLDAIKGEGYDVTTMVVITNSATYKKMKLNKTGNVGLKEDVLYAK